MAGKTVTHSSGPVIFEPVSTMDELIKQANSAGSIGLFEENKDILSLNLMIPFQQSDISSNFE